MLLDLETAAAAIIQQGEIADNVRAALLINSSHGPEACHLVDHVTYATVPQRDGWQRQGLVIEGTNLMLSDLVERLADTRQAIEPLHAADPNLDESTLRAALLVIGAILRSFEHQSRDVKHRL